MIANPKNLSEQLCNLSERLAVEMRALNRTKVSKVNGVVPDADGNVTIEVGSGDAIPKTGDRGVLAGYNTLNFLMNPSSVVVDGSINDDTMIMCQGGTTNVSFEKGGSGVWCKQVLLFNMGGSVTLSVPDDGSVMFDILDYDYALGMLDLFVYVWYGDSGSGIIYTKQIM